MFNILLILFLIERANPSDVPNSAYGVTFSVMNAGFEIEGTIKIKAAQINFHPDDFRKGVISAVADATTIETGIVIRDKHLRRSDYFDTNTFPEIRLQSKSFNKRRRNEFTGTFDLTIKSATREVAIPFTRKQEGNKVFYEGTFQINRLDFGLGEESFTLDNIVRVHVRAQGEF